MEQQKNGRENKRRTKCICVGVLLVWRSCRWRFSLALSLPGCSLVCQSHKCYICMCKKPLCWSAAPPLPPPFSVCGQPVCDLSAYDSSSSTATARLSDPVCCFDMEYLLFPGSCFSSRRYLCVGRGSKRTSRSPLSVTVSALNVCFSIFVLWFHLDSWILRPCGCFWRSRGYSWSIWPQTFTWQTKFSQSCFESHLLWATILCHKFNTNCLITGFGRDIYIYIIKLKVL